MTNYKVTFNSCGYEFSVVYTADVLDMVLDDPEVVEVMDLNTGEVLLWR